MFILARGFIYERADTGRMTGMRERHEQAIDRITVSVTGHHWIDGAEHAGGDGVSTVLNPTTGDPVIEFDRGTADEVDTAVGAAAAAAGEWASLGTDERAEYISEWTKCLETHSQQLAEMLTVEMGRPVAFAGEEVDGATDFLEYYAAVEQGEHGEHLQRGQDNHTYVRWEPYGVVGLILPWNYPLDLFAWKAGAALATGNTVVVKPSQNAPVALNRAVRLAGGVLPDGVLNVVNGTGSGVGTAMTDHKGIRKLSFTGSVPVGKRVMRAAADTVTPVSLELGGKNPFVVFPDADVEAAAEITAGGLFFNSGQSCGACSRVIVHESVHEPFIDALLAAVDAAWIPGDPLEPETGMGPLAFAARQQEVVEYVDAGTSAGATLVRGGDVPTADRFADGYFFEPTVFDRVDPDMRIAQEEIFGPVLTVTTFSEYDEAIEIANGVEYGLSAGLATESMTRAHRAAADLEAGSVWVNEWYNVGPGTPFGGFKQSGIGRECAAGTLKDYRQEKTVSISLGADPTDL